MVQGRVVQVVEVNSLVRLLVTEMEVSSYSPPLMSSKDRS